MAYCLSLLHYRTPETTTKLNDCDLCLILDCDGCDFCLRGIAQTRSGRYILCVVAAIDKINHHPYTQPDQQSNPGNKSKVQHDCQGCGQRP